MSAEFERPLSIITAEPGWRAVIADFGARFREAGNGRWAFVHFRSPEAAALDLDAIPTSGLGGIAHIIAWALVEHWEQDGHDLPASGEMLEPDGGSYHWARWVEPVTAASTGDIDIDPSGLIGLIPPGEQVDPAWLREALLDFARTTIRHASEQRANAE